MSTNSLEIKANIRNYIELNKTLIIFKLGRLELVRKPSILSPNGKSIIPPHNSCTFDDQIVNIDHSFVNYISTVNGKTKEENLELFKDFSNKIILEIEESGTAALEGFGYFFKRGNRILFSQNFEIPFKGSFGLPSINLSPIAKVEEDLIIKGTVSKPKLKVSNPYVNVAWNIIGTAAVFLLLVLGHRFITENKNGEESFGSHIPTQIDPAMFNKKPEKILIDNPNFNNLIPGISKREIVAAESQCALIVGSFSSKFNAADLQQKILNSDFELYTEEFHEFYRVGVSLDCESIKGATFLEIEKVLGVDPWLRVY